MQKREMKHFEGYLLEICVAESSKYQRRGDDLRVKAEVSLFDLVLGGEIEVPHPE